MSEESKKLHSRIRTFADDLKNQRKKNGVSTEAAIDSTKKIDPSTPKKDVVLAPRVEHVHIQEPKIFNEEAEGIKPETTANDDVPKVTTKIPAFHELKKQDNSTDKNTLDRVLNSSRVPVPPGKISEPEVTTENKKPSRKNLGYDSKVITDTKSERFKLFPAIIASIKSWFNAIKTNRKKKQAPKYSVAETNHRKGVIQKATSKSGAIFSADNATIKEQIRKRRQHDKEQEEIMAHEPETTWSPNTETGYNLLEAPDVTTKVVIEYKKARTPVTSEVVDTIEPTASQSHNSQDTDNTDIQLQTFTNQDEREDSEYKPETTDHEPENKKVEIDHSSYRLLNLDTNILTITILIMIVGVVTILFAARIINQQSSSADSEIKTVVAPEKSVIKNSELVNITLTQDAIEQIPQLIKSTIETAPMGLVEIPVISLSGSEMTPSYLFGLLRFQTLPNLRQSITTTRFATINHSSPIMVMRFVDEDTVRGGLLSWEKTMPSDMRALYNIPMEAGGKFTDEKIGDTDVRLLRYNNEILIIYGIINSDTLIITSKVSDFAQITELGFSD